MQLSVKRFFDYRPASQWAFDLEFSDVKLINSEGQLVEAGMFSTEELDRISKAVVSITQQKYKIEADTKCYGNFDFTIPKYDANDITMTVTFEETDDLLISHKLVGALMGNVAGSDSPAWLNVHPRIHLTIRRYNTYALDLDKTAFVPRVNNNSINGEQKFCCKMSGYTEPSYNRTSESPSAATCTITFLLSNENDFYNDESIKIVEPSDMQAAQKLRELVDTAKDFITTTGSVCNAAAVYFTGSVLGKLDVSSLRNSNVKTHANAYNIVTVTDSMLTESLNAAFASTRGGHGHTVTETLNSMHTSQGTDWQHQLYAKNLMALSTAITLSSNALKSLGGGYEFYISSINTGSHHDNYNSKSHFFGAKVDLWLFKDGKRIGVKEFSTDPELRAKVTKVLNENGLAFQAETKNTDTSLWLDCYLWYGYLKNPKNTEVYESYGTGWSANQDLYYTGTKRHYGWKV